MRPFTSTDRWLSRAFPVCAGIAGAGLLSMLVTQPTYLWIVYGIALVFLPVCGWARFRGRRRFEEIERIASQRGWRTHTPGWIKFTEEEVREIGRIEGPWMEEAIREISRPAASDKR